jgi:hypothetical protein
MIAVSTAPPAIGYETTPLTLKLPDCAAATTDGNRTSLPAAVVCRERGRI